MSNIDPATLDDFVADVLVCSCFGTEQSTLNDWVLFSAFQYCRSETSLWSCGFGGRAQLGYKTTAATEPEPREVRKLANSNIVGMAGGDMHSVAFSADGTVYTWGEGYPGALGHGDTASVVLPTQVKDFPHHVVQAAAGGDFTLVLCEESTADHVGADNTLQSLWAWGGNYSGQLGVNKSSNSLSSTTTPREVYTVDLFGITTDDPSRKRRVAQIQAGVRHSFALCDDGSLWAWGALASESVKAPVRATWFEDKITMISARYFHAVALSEDNKLWHWSVDKRTPKVEVRECIQFTNTSPVQSIASAGMAGALLLTADASLFHWSLGKEQPSKLPSTQTELQPPSHALQSLDAGEGQVVAVGTAGELFAWHLGGRGSDGECCQHQLQSVVSAAAGGGHFLVLCQPRCDAAFLVRGQDG
eukprot:TRINITY_DN112592_c0_g1_i1.p1 TRINITY_DN112592_c0_g1~~TRINITY_DN112592_c0_g1_i1.p1  ORF type:complete len:433 (-),score=38.49 TRINITY_DN112592_c0_g1_i1:108-1358(-)